MSTVSSKELQKNHYQVSLVIGFDEVKQEFEKNLREQAKKAQIDGFRPGKVPLDLIKKMKGGILLTQALFHQVEHKIMDHIKDEKLDIVGQPLMMSVPDIKLPATESYTFEFEIGLKPEFSLPALSKKEITQYKIELAPSLVQEEIELIQRKFGKLEDTTEVKNKEDLLHLDFVSEDKADASPKQDVLLVKYFKDSVAKTLIGKKVGDTWGIKLQDAFEDRELDWVLKDLGLQDKATDGSKKFNVTISKIGHISPAELNEDIFKKVFPAEQITTALEFEEKIKSQIQAEFDRKSEDYVHNDLYFFLMDNTTMELPIQFLDKWYAQRDRSEEEKNESHSPEKFETFLDQLKWSLILQKIGQEQKIEVDKDVILAQIKKDIDAYYAGYDETQKSQAMIELLRNEDYLYKTQQRLLNDKIFEWASQQVKLTPKKTTLEEFQKAIESQHTKK